jgi:hypothetical protein
MNGSRWSCPCRRDDGRLMSCHDIQDIIRRVARHALPDQILIRTLVRVRQSLDRHVIEPL